MEQGVMKAAGQAEIQATLYRIHSHRQRQAYVCKRAHQIRSQQRSFEKQQESGRRWRLAGKPGCPQMTRVCPLPACLCDREVSRRQQWHSIVSMILDRMRANDRACSKRGFQIAEISTAFSEHFHYIRHLE